MNSTSRTAAAVTAALLVLATFGANAQTGRPSEAPSDTPVAVQEVAGTPGSYARYLMLNGTPRDVALVEARNIDHPAPSTHFALRGARAAKSGDTQPATSQR